MDSRTWAKPAFSRKIGFVQRGESRLRSPSNIGISDFEKQN